MKSSTWLMGAVTVGLGLAIVSGARVSPSRPAFSPTSAFAQDDNNADYEADQARQRDEDAEQQQRYQQEQQEQQEENAREQDEANRDQGEQRHQEEMDRLNSEHEEQQN